MCSFKQKKIKNNKNIKPAKLGWLMRLQGSVVRRGGLPPRSGCIGREQTPHPSPQELVKGAGEKGSSWLGTGRGWRMLPAPVPAGGPLTLARGGSGRRHSGALSLHPWRARPSSRWMPRPQVSFAAFPRRWVTSDAQTSPSCPRFTPGGGAQRPPISGRESPPHAERLTLALFVQTSS